MAEEKEMQGKETRGVVKPGGNEPGFWDLKARGTSVLVEVNGGLTTFLTLSYIIFVQPIILAGCGMDPGAVMVATCLASALATLVMAFVTNFPFALAPAMGHNLFFAFTVCGALGFTWQVALAANLVAGILFFILVLLGVQTAILKAVSDSLKNAIAVGIGLMIAFLGFEWSGMITDDPVTLVRLGDLGSAPVLLSLIGLVVIAVLMVRKFRAAFIVGMVVTALAGLLLTWLTQDTDNPIAIVTWHGAVGEIPDLSPTFFQLDFAGLADLELLSAITVVLIFLFLDIFDTMGTLIGVGEQAGIVKDGTLPRAKGAFLSDSVGTMAGTVLGTSTVTTYVESASGVAAGARTGVANIVTACCFLLALFFSPLMQTLSGGYALPDGRSLYPVLAPVLIVVGYLMMKNVSRIAWEDPTEGLPAFLAIGLMMFTFSITEGIAMGFVATSVLKTAAGRFRDVSWVIHLMSVLFVLRWVFLV